MRKFIVATTLLASAATTANAKDIGPLTQALVDHMALTYYCRLEIGDAHYLAARTITTDTLSRYVGKDAVLHVDQFDKKLKSDPRADNPNANAAQCYQMKADAMHRIEVERAKLAD